MIKVRLSELELADMGDEIWDDLFPRAEAAARRGAEMIVARAKQNLSRPGSASTASQPGEPPEMDSGRLKDSMQVFGVKTTKYSVRAEYGSDHPAAGLHEWGGSVQGRTYPPRPYLRPAEDATAAEVDELVRAL